ncbi:MAG TPA: hypothetical protein DCE41_16495 [Cytophagales bacterium]|nr:hypothetical protein [Cytophagales bacterium]HAA17610.1 hypothetical protein [Cytophagales bacterium]HAP63971.1 hypothetical protein [Cytophagales bacterium]
MRAFSLLLLVGIFSTLVWQCADPIDEDFGGFTPETIRRLLARDSSQAWVLVSRSIDGTQQMTELCEDDDLLIFVDSDTDSLVLWSRDSVYCLTEPDTMIIDSILTDSGYVQAPDSLYDTLIGEMGVTPVWSWRVPDIEAFDQITIDTVYVETDSSSSLRRVFDISSLQFSWRYWVVTDTVSEDSSEYIETYSATEFTWPIVTDTESEDDDG